jgi:phosphohistidine phosphatase SixA
MYSPNQQTAWADTIRQPPFLGKKLLIVGHSNTIPPLANLLIGQKKYENLADSEYGVVFQITITGDTISDNKWQY